MHYSRVPAPNLAGASLDPIVVGGELPKKPRAPGCCAEFCSALLSAGHCCCMEAFAFC